MPEGDTLWNAAATLRPALVGVSPEHIHVHRPRHRVRGERIDAVEARGKHLLITFDNGDVVHTHLKMSGEWHLYRAGQRWRDSPGAVRVRIATPEHEAICFRAPTVDVYPARDPRVRPWDRLGPDLCDDDADLDQALRLARSSDQHREIGDLLLDQWVAAGIGNVYKSETLWACRVDPFRPVAECDDATIVDLFSTASRLLRMNLGTGRRRITHRQGVAVYGRARRDCPRCHGTITMARQGDLARSTYWCRRCQTG